jgi:hypothetical protein
MIEQSQVHFLAKMEIFLLAEPRLALGPVKLPINDYQVPFPLQ